MATFSVVLDACVLIPSYVRTLLLDAAERELFRPVWSTLLLDETERNLAGQGLMTSAQAARLRGILEHHFEDALVDAPAHLVAAMANHPKDRHVLATAVHAGAQVIVTENLKDFPKRVLQPHGIEAKSVDAFLMDLFHLSPPTMREVVQGMSARYKNPPMGLQELVALLARSAPGFAALVGPPPQILL